MRSLSIADASGAEVMIDENRQITTAAYRRVQTQHFNTLTFHSSSLLLRLTLDSTTAAPLVRITSTETQAASSVTERNQLSLAAGREPMQHWERCGVTCVFPTTNFWAVRHSSMCARWRGRCDRRSGGDMVEPIAQLRVPRPPVKIGNANFEPEGTGERDLRQVKGAAH